MRTQVNRALMLATGVVLLLLGGAACGSCRKATFAPQELLVVLPSATDVKRSTNTVAYRVNDTYPAPTTVKALGDAMIAKSCVLLADGSPSNPFPAFKIGAWEADKMRDGGTAMIWTGDWQCQGGVIVFNLISKRDEDQVQVGGAYFTDDQAKRAHKMTRTVE
jgi:hypothetical protein